MPDPPSSPPLPLAQETLFQLTIGNQMIGAAIRTVVDLGVADRLGTSRRPVSDLARELAVHESHLRRLLATLAGVGLVVDEPPGTFGLTAVGNAMRSDAPGSMRDFARYALMPVRFRALEGLTEGVRLGSTAFEVVYGSAVFDFFASHPEGGRLFDAAMTGASAQFADAFLRSFDFGGIRKWVDVGGGNGRMIAAVLRAHPGLRGTLFDLPSVVERARPLLSAEGVLDRCHLEGGSFFERVPTGGDVYFLRLVIHDWDDEQATAILRTVRHALSPGSRVVIADVVLPEGTVPLGASVIDLNMLAFTGGRERTRAEFVELLGRAGLALERVVPTPSPASLVLARAA
ncbi:MAG TPA: methyltransferase [Thermoplasmata archaeon]|nr:methyltransferase [Thermoplasmata archaeon]